MNKNLNYRNWTPTSIHCYTIGCRCSICNIPSTLTPTNICQTKKAVLILVRKFGKPKTTELLNHILED